MGKKRHSQDRMFLTATEWKELGGKRDGTSRTYRPLAFDSCALSLAPYETPVCGPEGVVYDILNIIPYIQKHKKSPITGEPMTTKDILRLNMAKNSNGNWHCPVTFKEFNDNTHIVAIKPSGNVYAMDAINELNIKHKNWTDLMTGEPFTRKDIITLQDPSNPEHMSLRDISNFKHLQEVRDDEAARIAASDHGSNIRANPATDLVLKEFQQRQKREREEEEEKKRAAEAEEEGSGVTKKAKILIEDLHPGKHVTSGRAAASFTATGVDLATDAHCREASEEEVQEARWKVLRKLGKKGYVQMQTSVGNLNLEVHADFVPCTAENFLTLCANGAYDGVTFHRVVKGFMVQGGDPTGTGRGGESIYGKPFKDEFDSRLLHDGRGILSMANSGPNSNKAQFFITFKACRHLDNVHSVFGRVVGGAATTLARMEEAETDKGDKPVKEIKIIKAVVFEPNPVVEAHKAFDDMIAERRKMREEREDTRKANSALGSKRVAPKTGETFEDGERIGFYSQPGPVPSGPSSAAAGGGGVGKYLGAKSSTTLPKLAASQEGGGGGAASAAEALLRQSTGVAVAKTKPPVGGSQFKDFSGW